MKDCESSMCLHTRGADTMHLALESFMIGEKILDT